MNNIILAIVAVSSVACAADGEQAPTHDGEPVAASPEPPTAPPPSVEDAATSSEAPALCDALWDLATSGAPVDLCEDAIAEDCDRIVGTLSEDYVSAVEQCIAGGYDILACMSASVDAFDVTLAHHELAAAFCDACVFDVPQCTELFYVNDSQWGLGTLLLPFSAEVLDTIRAECTESFTCAFDFPSCAMDVVAERLHVDASRECLLDLL